MEPVTHILTGACLARTGFNRRVAYATAAMAIAAEFPDIDTVWSIRGPVSGFEHHRGITHTLLGFPFEAALLLLSFYLYHQWLTRRAAIPLPARSTPNRTAPVRWASLYGLLLLALGSHLLLDWTNNYGIRPFFPFHDAWYAGSIVFIFDPLIFLLLLAGLLLPVLFGLIGSEVGAKREPYRGRGWARTVLAGIVLLWGVRWVEHQHALALAQNQTLRAPASAQVLGASEVTDTGPEPSPASSTESPRSKDQTLGDRTFPAPDPPRPLLAAERSWASPDPFSIFRWYTATDFGPAYRLGMADSRLETLLPGAILEKAQPSASLLTAQRTHLGRVYLDWSAMPLLRISEGSASNALDSGSAEGHNRMVIFSDLRFFSGLPLLEHRGRPPVSGEVVLDPSDRVLAQGLDGRFGR